MRAAPCGGRTSIHDGDYVRSVSVSQPDISSTCRLAAVNDHTFAVAAARVRNGLQPGAHRFANTVRLLEAVKKKTLLLKRSIVCAA